MAIQRPSGVQANGGSGQSLVGGDAASYFPVTWEWLTSEQYDDGSARETSTLLIFVEDGCVKLCFNDRGGDRKLWATGRDALAALTALEGMLATGAGEWRAANGKGRKPRK